MTNFTQWLKVFKIMFELFKAKKSMQNWQKSQFYLAL